MKNQQKPTKGFTLIEMLVVVLIIAALGGISMQKYQRVKYKAETRKLLIPLKAIKEAQKRFYTENRYYADNLDDLDVNVSNFTGECKLNFPYLSYCRSSGNISVFYQPASGEIGAFFNDGKYKQSGFLWHTYNDYIECYDFYKNKMCEENFNCTMTGHTVGDHYYRCSNL